MRGASIAKGAAAMWIPGGTAAISCLTLGADSPSIAFEDDRRREGRGLREGSLMSLNRMRTMLSTGLAMCNVLAAAAAAQDVSFVARRDFDVGRRPQSVTMGDFNGDGVPDLAVANDGSNNLSVLLGNGDGTFQTGRNFAAGSHPGSVAAGDFNGDGVLDLVVANKGSPPYFLDGSIYILIGTGSGDFTSAQTIAAGDTPASVAVADFDSDGLSDLVVVNYGYYVEDGGGGYDFVPGTTSRIFFGNGDGTFRLGLVL